MPRTGSPGLGDKVTVDASLGGLSVKNRITQSESSSLSHSLLAFLVIGGKKHLVRCLNACRPPFTFIQEAARGKIRPSHGEQRPSCWSLGATLVSTADKRRGFPLEAVM